MKKYFALGCVTTIATLFPVVSLAASMNVGPNVSVEGTSVTQGSVYAAGRMVTVSGLVNGDLLAAGGTVISSAKVSGDIMAAGGAVTMVGVTAQDVRVVGGNITVGGTMTGELVAAGGALIIVPETAIMKDSYLGGGSVNFSGSEAGNLKISGGVIYFDGTVNGNLTIDHATKVTIGPHAAVKGTFEYSAPVAATIDSAANIAGTPIFHELQNTNQKKGWFMAATFGILTLGWFLKLLVVLTTTYLLWYLFRNDSLAVLDQSRSRYGKSLLRGFIFLVVLPIGAIIAIITVIGAIPGCIALLAYGALLLLAAPFAALFATVLLRRGRTDLRWYHILLGTVVISLVGFIPLIGWVAYALVYLGVLGAATNVLREKFIRK
jgi:hypothetical protein